MENNEEKVISLKYIVIAILSGLLILGILYKYMEWRTLSNLVSFINQVDTNELSLVEDQLKYTKVVSDNINILALPTFTKSSLEDQKIGFDKLISSIRILKDHNETYRNTVSDNYISLTRISRLTPLFVGKNGDFMKQVVGLKTRYYQNEINASENSILTDQFSINMFQIWKENAIYKDFEARTIYSNAMDSNLKKYWSDFGIFEKYTKDDFKFVDEDKIKEKRPYGYEYLEFWKNFFSSSYNVLKDYVMGDTESVSYKLSKLQNDSYALNTDFDKLSSEGKDKQTVQAQDTVNIVSKLTQLMKQYKSNHLGSYPLLTTPKGWNEDLIQCQIYGIKISIYKEITGNYPVSSSSAALITELETVGPNTKQVDDLFDKSVLTISNDPKFMKYTCLDKTSNHEYSFTINK